MSPRAAGSKLVKPKAKAVCGTRADLGAPGQCLRRQTGQPPSLGPIRSVQRPVLDGLGNMLAFDLRAAVDVGDGAGDLENPVVGASAQALLLHGPLQHAFALRTQVAVGSNLARPHLRVRINALAAGCKTIELNLARAQHPLADLRRALRFAVAP